MIKIEQEKLNLTIDDTKLKTLTVATKSAAQNILAKVWGEDIEYLSNFIAIYYNDKIKELDDDSSFITISHTATGYIANPTEIIDIEEARKQIDIDLEIINRESGWKDSDSIFFGDWWPKPNYNTNNNTLEFGAFLQDNKKTVINKTINRIVLTRFGYLEINFSLSNKEVDLKKDISKYQKILDEVVNSIEIESGFTFKDVNEDIDSPSKSKMLNLVLSAEIF